ncbi:sigma-54-dependent transcriptional regulator [Candidatus Margulisiibacteriota bacterium]
MHNILVVDDEFSIRESFSLILEDKYNVLTAASGEAALKKAADQKVELVYLDIRMPGMNGLETLKRLKKIDPDLEIVMVTAVNEVQKASEAVKLGARDYLVKPFDIHHVLKLSEQILRKKAIQARTSRLQKKSGESLPQIIGQTEKIAQLRNEIEALKNDDPVLLLGEDGTEKKLISRLIHESSSRSGQPFKIINFSQSTSLAKLRRQLFGTSLGATTADLQAQPGILEQTRDGTSLLNNLGALPEELFKIIASGEFSRVGQTNKMPLEARLIGFSSSDLPQEVCNFFGKTTIRIPPLRDRTSDIPLLIEFYLDQSNANYRKQVKLSAQAADALTSYSWPGNLVELEILIARLVIANPSGEIELSDLPFDLLLNVPGVKLSNLAEKFEAEYIEQIFNCSGKDKQRTAAFLGINPTVLETKI